MSLDVIAAGTGYISAAGTDSSNPMVGVILKASLAQEQSFTSQNANAGQSFAAKNVEYVTEPSNTLGRR